VERIVRVAVALGAGVLLVLSFPPFDVWPAGIVAVAALVLVVRGRSWRLSAALGFAFGLAFFTPLLHWTPVQTGPIPWILLSIAQALFMVPTASVVMLVQRLRLAPLWIGAAWVGQEALRGRIPWGGLTWGKLGFGQTDGPLLDVAAWGGSVGITFTVALLGGCAAALVWSQGWRRLLPLGTATTVLAVAMLIPSTPPNGEQLQVAVVQGNVPRAGLGFNERAHEVTQNHSEATIALAEDVQAGRAPAPDVVIWAENSSDRNPLTTEDAGATDNASRELIERAATAIEAPIHVGAVVPTADERNVRNTSIVWHPETGPGETYVKRHPMPFGEYIPMRDLARIVTDAVDLQPRDFIAGEDVGVLSMGGAEFATAICFEVAFDNLVRDGVRAGGDVIMVPTNNATFGYSPMSEQQLAMSQVRAVEHSRPVVHSALSGVSAVVATDGSIRERTELYTEDIINIPITTSTVTTVATTLGEVPEFVLSGIAVAAALAGVVVRRRAQEPTGAQDANRRQPQQVGA